MTQKKVVTERSELYKNEKVIRTAVSRDGRGRQRYVQCQKRGAKGTVSTVRGKISVNRLQQWVVH